MNKKRLGTSWVPAFGIMEYRVHRGLIASAPDPVTGHGGEWNKTEITCKGSTFTVPNDRVETLKLATGRAGRVL